MDDSNVNVDDLFNDELEQAALNIPLPGNDVVEATIQPLTPEFKVQLDELHTNGCRQRISWSRLGCVASISPDSTSVRIQCLRLNQRTATWGLSSVYNLEPNSDGPEIQPWMHLCWSSTGVDLAVFDRRGRVSIFAMSTASAVNRFQDLNCPNCDDVDELGQTVGTFWLPAADRESAAISQMSKQDDQWTLAVTKRKPIGPIWPRSLLFITRLGSLKLIYMKLDRTWAETEANLQISSTTQGILTHAAFAPTVDGSVVVTTHSASGRFSVYSVQVNRPPFHPDQMVSTPITLTIEHIKSDVHNHAISTTLTTDDLMGSNSSKNQNIVCLSHLEIIPTTDVEKAVQIPPTIFAINTIFSSIPGLQNSLEARSSIIHRWSLHTVPQALHSRFDEIPTKGNTNHDAKTNQIKTLQRLPSMSFDGIITSVHLVEFSTAVAITTADGTTTFYNPSTMSPIYYEASSQEVTSLSQAGFSFSPTLNPFSLAFSPNACCVAALPSSFSSAPSSSTSSSKTQPFVSSITHPSTIDPSPSSTLDAALAAMALTYCRASYAGITSDDLVHCILSTCSPTHVSALTHVLLNLLFRPGDFIRQTEKGSDLDKLASKPHVPKCLSLFASLGVVASPSPPEDLAPAALNGNANGNELHSSPQPQNRHKDHRIHRTPAARYAYLSLQIRHAALMLMFVVNSAKAPPPPAGQNQQQVLTQGQRLPPDLTAMASASVVWIFGLARWIVDELCAIDDGEEEGETGDRELVGMLLGGVWSRYFLKMVERVFRMAVGVTGSAAGAAGALDLAMMGRQVRNEARKGVGLGGLGAVLDCGEKFVGTGMGPDAERQRLAEGRGGREGVQLLEKIVREVLPVLRQSGEVDKLAVYTSTAGMGGKGLGWTLLEDGDVDVHRKVVFDKGGGTEVRRCVRCASISEDIAGPKREWPKWVQQQMSRCVCEGSFWVEGFDE